MNLSFPTLDGITPSWADVNIKCAVFAGPLFENFDIKSLDTGATVDIGEQRSGGRVMHRGTGDSSHTASMTLYRSGWQKFIRNAGKVAPKRGRQKLLSLVHFDIQVQHTPPGSIEIYEFKILGCRVAGWAANGAEGPELDTVDVPLSVSQIVHVVDGEEIVIG